LPSKLPVPSPAGDLPRRGEYVGPYRVHGEIGRGSLGVVYRAVDPQTRRWVALKLARPGARESEEELRAEARRTSRFRHRNVIRAYASGEYEGRPFLALELLDGEDLASRIDRIGRLPMAEVLAIAHDVARGLAALHRQGVVQRDLKPTNVRVTAAGRAKILDLGTPAAQRRRIPGGGFEYFGTPEYSAPEQCMCQERRIGPATDLYALGVMIYEMVAGRPPFDHARTTRVLREQVSGRAIPLADIRPTIPERLATLVEHLLEKEPAKRPRRAGGVALELSRIAAERGERMSRRG
jgi:serine/threonine protein kinase